MSDKTSNSLRLKRGRYTAIADKYYRTPKEIWNFRTAARGGSPESIARDFVVANAALYKLEDGVSELAVQRVIRSLGATHVIFKGSRSLSSASRLRDGSHRSFRTRISVQEPLCATAPAARKIREEHRPRRGRAPRPPLPAQARPAQRSARDRKAVVSQRK